MTDPTPNQPPTLKAPALRFDWRDWLPYVENEDIREDQKRALIESLWSIVVAFVDYGWSVKEEAAPTDNAIDLKAALEAAVLNSDSSGNDGEEEAA